MQTMAVTFLTLSVFVSIVGGFAFMKTRHTRMHGITSAGGSFALAASVGFIMTAGPVWVLEVLR